MNILGPRHTLAKVTMLSTLSVLATVSAAQAKKPNVIIIVTDDHGYADLGAYNLTDDIRTPHMDKLANEGALVTNGYSTAPQCVPSRGAIATAKYQTGFGLECNIYCPMKKSETTVAERMRDAGYMTGFVGKWHLEPTRESREWMKTNYPEGLKMKKPQIPIDLRWPYMPASRGYTEYFDGTMDAYWRNFDLDGNTVKSGREIDRETFRVDKQTDAALAFIKRNHDKPFFLHLNYYAPHVKAEYVKKYFDRFPGEMSERRRWGLASIAAVDDGVGSIMESLRNYDLEEDTIIFYFSDNGAPLILTKEDLPFDQPGWDGSLNGPLVGEKGMITDGGVRVPYCVYWKGKIKPQVYENQVSTMDAGATALALAGVKTENGELDGVNLMPYLTGENKDVPHEALFWRFWGQSAVRVGKWKFMYLATGVRMLFDMDTDQHETKNLVEKYPEVAARLEKRLATWRDNQEYDGFPVKYKRERPFYRHYFGLK